MSKFAWSLVLTLCLLAFAAVSLAQDDEEAANNTPKVGPIVRAELKTCSGCQLKKMPLVQKWIHTEAPLYSPHFTVNYVHGADPIIFFYDAQNLLVEFVRIAGKNPEALDEIMQSRGLVKKERAQKKYAIEDDL